MYSWGDNRRFNSYSGYFKRKVGERLQKVTIDAGFTCPNRDGVLSEGGCSFCNNRAFNPSYCTAEKSITQQINEGIEFHAHRYGKTSRFLAYFQAFSNTYKPLEELKEIYSEALSHPLIAGIVIGTRPDCVDSDKLDYFATLTKEHYVIIEYGIESCYNTTLARVNRGHTFEQAVWAINETHKRGINCGAHFILGLPGESREMMLSGVDLINELPLDTVKFHQLQIFKDSAMELEYNEHPEEFDFFGREEYIDFFIEILTRLRPDIVVERFAGESPPRFHAGPVWGLTRNNEMLVLLEKRLAELDTYQGKEYIKK